MKGRRYSGKWGQSVAHEIFENDDRFQFVKTVRSITIFKKVKGG
jgi:hypothetical protein